MYNLLINGSPNYNSECVTRNSSIRTKKINIHRSKERYFGCSFSVYAAVLWNALPLSLKHVGFSALFKKELNSPFFRRALDWIECVVMHSYYNFFSFVFLLSLFSFRLSLSLLSLVYFLPLCFICGN